VCLRGAGFPISGVLRLAAPQAAAAADRLRAAEDLAEQRRQEAVQVMSAEIGRAERSALDGLVKAIHKVKKGRLPAAADLPAVARAAVEGYAVASEEARRLADEYLAAFTTEHERLSSELRDVARDGRFREAVLWQNRHVLKTGIDSLLRRAAGGRTSSKERQHEQVVASYLQRFCTKNDTIGFFGPVGWAEVGEGEEPIAVRHGADFLADRRVFFEGWCIDLVAERLSADRALRIGLAPRREAFVGADGRLMGGALGPELSPERRAALALCDGERPARELAETLVAAGTFPEAAAVYEALDELQSGGLMSWGFELPVVLEPDRELRRQVEGLRVADEAREPALRTLDELEADRRAVAEAAGDERALDAALARLEERFTRLTGLGATRGHGQTYAGRTLVYEDCRRGTEVELGADVLAALAPPLSLMLTSARWLTHAAAELHRDLFDEAHRELQRETGSSRVALLSFCRKVLPLLLDARTSPVRHRLLPLFRERWAEVLDLPGDGVRQVSYSSEELRPRVLRVFDAPRPGWKTARQHSPDLLFAASGPEAIRRGDYRFVLGELHVATNTLATNLFVAQHPAPGELLAAMESDLPEPCVIPTLPKVWRRDGIEALLGTSLPGLTGRLDFGLVAAKDLFVEITRAPAGLPRSRVLPLAELSVEPGESGLEVVSPERGRRFALLDFLEMALMTQVVGVFKIFAPQPHLPRVTIDRLIVWRESWSIQSSDLQFAHAATEALRFAGARRWAEGTGLPRLLFVKSPSEPKPFFLDLESPLSVEIFAKAARYVLDSSRGEARILFSEMVPTPAETWLPDAAGQRYASELRFVAVDRSG
jgi:hypothetical protein